LISHPLLLVYNVEKHFRFTESLVEKCRVPNVLPT
jgi:hypothetical protein